ncbi:hypothetical protein FQA39_LY13732 [Lamprigera yunnana]|nr:hypothetical protein FQA39_LY13732 [Lamprigera yunnana]
MVYTVEKSLDIAKKARLEGINALGYKAREDPTMAVKFAAAHKRASELYAECQAVEKDILIDELGDTGQFKPKSDVGQHKNLSANQEDDILVRISDNPELSTRHLSGITLKFVDY